MRFKWTTELPQLVLIVAMFAAGVVVWPRVPERIPVHWDIHDQVDRYGGRLEGLFAMPLAAIVLYAMLMVIPRFDARSRNHAHRAAFATIRYSILVFVAVIHTLVLATALGQPLPITTVLFCAAGSLLAVIGSQLPQIGPNWLVGVRTPWTLANDVSWQKTHLLARWLLPFSGMAVAAAGVLRTEWALMTAIGLFIGSMLSLVTYSYVIWRQETR